MTTSNKNCNEPAYVKNMGVCPCDYTTVPLNNGTDWKICVPPKEKTQTSVCSKIYTNRVNTTDLYNIKPKICACKKCLLKN